MYSTESAVSAKRFNFHKITGFYIYDSSACTTPFISLMCMDNIKSMEKGEYTYIPPFGHKKQEEGIKPCSTCTHPN